METNFTSPALRTGTRAQALIEHLRTLEAPLGLVEGVLYYDFPVFRDTDDVLYRSQVLLASRCHGAALLSTPELS